MKFSVPIVLAILVLILAAPAFAGGGKDGCKPMGSWYGYDSEGNAWWTSTIDGQSASHGTSNLEIPGSVAFFPGASGVTELKGQWKRSGPNAYAWTVVAFPFDENAVTLSIVKLSGTNHLGENCDTMWITNIVMEVFYPWDDIYTDTPILVDDSFPDHPGFRVKVDLPELLP